MIRRLRWKFILINLLLVGLVLTVVFVLLLTSNARRLADQGSAALHMALNRGDDELPPRFEIGAPPEQENRYGDSNASMIPVFSVTVEDGTVVSINDGGHVDVSEETAAQAAQEGDVECRDFLEELEELLKGLCEIYDAPPEEIRGDVQEFLAEAAEKKVVELL